MNRRRPLRRLLLVLPLLLAATPAPADDERDPPAETFRDSLDVHRIVVDVRVIDHRGKPVPELGVEDFRVRIGKREVEIESIEWSEAETANHQSPAPEPVLSAPPSPNPASGRLLVLFFQTADFYMEAKASGHLRMLPRVQELVDSLEPGDRVALLRYGARLDLDTDFTTDHDLARRAVHRVILGRMPPTDDTEPDHTRPRDSPVPSLASHLDPGEARRAATPEKALRLVAEALVGIPGPKSLVWVGWGLGTRQLGRVQMERDYDPAMAALEAGRTSVFVLDVSEADYHTLEDGLRQVAWASGGTYSGTWHFPDVAVRMLQQALSGRYTLVLAAPRLEEGEHRLRIDLVRAGQSGIGPRVLAPAVLYGDRAQVAAAVKN